MEMHGVGALELTRKKQRELGKGPFLKEGVKDWRVLVPEKSTRQVEQMEGKIDVSCRN